MNVRHVRLEANRKTHPDIVLDNPPTEIKPPVPVHQPSRGKPATFPLEKLRKRESIAIEEVPQFNPLGQFGKRRWQALVEEIIQLSERGRALPVDVPLGIDPDVVQSGMREEAKRFKSRLHTSKISNNDGSITMYFFAEPFGDNYTPQKRKKREE